MPSDEHTVGPPLRPRVPMLALLLALVGLLMTEWSAVDRGAVRSVLSRDLQRITALASLQLAAGAEQARATMPVRVAQEGGPMWVTDAAAAAIAEDPIFIEGDPHLLRIEVVQQGRTYGVRGQLWRQGWSLRAPEPLWVVTAPWVVLVSLLAGAGWAGLRRGLGGGLMLAGLLAQSLLMALPWPQGFVRPTLEHTWREGPLGHEVIAVARTLPDVSVAVGAGIITLCALLMLFDHRRSPGRGGGLVAGGLLGVLGVLLWLEASMRAGLGPWIHQLAGVTAMAGAVGLWWWAWRRRRPSPVPEESL